MNAKNGGGEQPKGHVVTGLNFFAPSLVENLGAERARFSVQVS